MKRLPFVYPVYEPGYEAALAGLDRWVGSLPRVTTFGRLGLFAHDNTHHAMAMAYDAVSALETAVDMNSRHFPAVKNLAILYQKAGFRNKALEMWERALAIAPDEETKKVFEDFEQLSKGDARDSSGMGLGLPIARRLARAMGGDVWYERRFPTGARFCYSLPLNRRTVLVDEDAPELSPDQMVRVEVPETVHSFKGV